MFDCVDLVEPLRYFGQYRVDLMPRCSYSPATETLPDWPKSRFPPGFETSKAESGRRSCVLSGWLRPIYAFHNQFAWRVQGWRVGGRAVVRVVGRDVCALCVLEETDTQAGYDAQIPRDRIGHSDEPTLALI